ncbi:MAG: cation:proton antiporter [Gammaproteobacteria bacterium]|nr:cation:proton antiporter [Gammaproteobacteria bacterium]MCF6261011.1 cation:proton antiporter [Gammaproteobacteria bacterium]
MQQDPFAFTLFLIFTGAAIIATIALYARQALLVAYILLGVLLGPSAFGLVTDPVLIKQLSHVGIMFLLFLLGLNLPLAKLIPLLKETTLVTGLSSLLFAIVGVAVGWGFGFTIIESLIIGAALTFSSTIIGLKLLPTTVLHHKRTGEIIISILLVQDLIAIIILLLLQTTAQTAGQGSLPWVEIALRITALPLLIAIAYVLERFILIKLIERFDKIQEYIFLLAIAWCLGFAELAASAGLSTEIGAFIAGVTLARSPIALFIGEKLKPLRDFFLIIFFFSLGASFDLRMLSSVFVPAILLAAVVLVGKPLVFRWLLRGSGETSGRSSEVGVRLGQISEFSLLIAVLALELNIIGSEASYTIQLATLLTFIVSSYIIVQRYPTPIAINDKLRRD